ncbi:MAG: V-type ATP synthase subunit D [Lachnospiraceae bacterium]
MDPNSFPTKGNLILAKNSLALAKQGYELMDKKRNILIRELMELIDKADKIQGEILDTYKTAYKALQKANIEQGINNVMEVAGAVPPEDGIEIKTRSIMGVEIPLIRMEEKKVMPTYSFYGSTEALDTARIAFEKVKRLSVELAEIENSAYRLAYNVKKTQKRANALKNITIPHYDELTRSISNALEEKEREEFTRLKVIKRRMNDSR